MDRSQVYLDATVGRLKKAADLHVTSTLVKGPIAETLVGQSAAGGADLSVMTTHARGPLGRFWFGSIADALVRQSPIPILIAPPQIAAPDVGQQAALRHVLIPLDGSELAEQAIEPALALGVGTPAEYTLLRVVAPIMALAGDHTSGRISGVNVSLLRELDELQRRQRIEATEYLEQLAKRLRARSFSVHTEIVLDDRPANAVLESASTVAAEAIAMTTRGRGGLKRLFLGSVADKVLRGATMPVLICPPAG
jgi:nucleotide-binding universal stress UspA family protein